LKLKDVAKAMGKLFASGASVSDTASGGKEIVIQGDVMEGVAAMLEDKYQVREGGKGGKERVGGLFLGFAKENGAGSFECRLIFPPFILDIRCRKKTLFSSRRLPVGLEGEAFATDSAFSSDQNKEHRDRCQIQKQAS
jgi:hypothetical protein